VTVFSVRKDAEAMTVTIDARFDAPVGQETFTTGVLNLECMPA
jgi:hypothetical protein